MTGLYSLALRRIQASAAFGWKRQPLGLLTLPYPGSQFQWNSVMESRIIIQKLPIRTVPDRGKGL